MKKIFTLALVALMTATFAVAAPAKKDKKQKKAKTEFIAPANLLSKSDSLSYAAGMSATRGLMDYVSKQFGVDSTTMESFVSGIREGLERKTDKQFVAHSGGIQIAQMLDSRIYTGIKGEMEHTPWTTDSVKFYEGFFAAVLGDTTVMKTEKATQYFQQTLTDEKKRQDEAYKKENADWLAENAKKEGVVTLPSGLQYKVIEAGSGEKATKDDNVTVRYEGKTIDGNVFDSSYKRNPNTTQFRPDQVIKGWTEALTMMPEGSTWMLYIPENLAYGSRPAGQIKPYSTLIFKVELVKVDHKKTEEAKDEKTTSAAKTSAKKTPAKKGKK